MADGNESQNQNTCCSAEACNGQVKAKDNNAEVNSSEINPSNENTTEPKSSATKKNKKKKKKKLGGEEGDNVDGTLATGAEPSTSTSDASTIKPNMMDINRFMQQLSLAKGKTEVFSEEEKKSFVFWETQPVPKMDEVVPVDTNQAVEENPDEIRKEPFTLPTGFVWDNVLLNEEGQLSELYTLLNENYVEDDDNMFRFDYSPEFLKWALQPPGWKSQWHCGVRVASNKKLVGFISAIPAKIKVYDKAVEMVEINFLCVHKKLRAKRVAPVLIREITRRVNVEGVFQAVYTAGIVLPKPVGTCRYWHRSINPKKLIEVKFSHLRKNMTMQRTIKLYKLPESTKTALVPLTEADLQSGYKLVSEYLSKFNLAPILTEEEFSHWFLPRKDVIACYAIKDRDTGAVTDLVSFYQLPSTVVDHPKYSSLKAAYSYYNVASSTDITTLMNDALILARDEGYDVFNALNLMENSQFLEKLKFGIGDGNLNYYLYNWKCPTITTEKVGLVLQ